MSSTDDHATSAFSGQSQFIIGPLQEPVSIFRDEWGIPHIQAMTTADAFIAQGYVHAQDRLWQMDSARRQMEGRWSEWVGPSGIAADKLARRLRAAAASKRDYDALGDDARLMVDSYAAGVNAYLSEDRPLPLEYQLVGGTPERWEGWHCVAAMRQRGFLMGSVWFKLWRAAALSILTPDQVAKLRYDDGGKERLCIPPGTDARRWIAALQDLAPAVEAVAKLQQADSTDGGSNNWAIAPSRTATGRPILAGDPHRAFEMPGMYAQMHLACDQFDAIGLTVPGVPAFPHFAHNGTVAWCVTHAFADIHDLYIEQFDVEDPSKYLFCDEWLAAEFFEETIRVRGEADTTVEIVRTQHGAVIAGAPGDGAAITLKSIQVEGTDRSFDTLLPMLRSTSCDSFYASTKGWGLIDHNLVTADTEGNIGHLVRALVPRRPALNGWLPVPGWTGEYEWDGVIPWESMPRVDNPERGYIVTANNRVVSTIDETGDYFCTDAHPPHRASRIEQLLEGMTSANIAQMSEVHADTASAPAAIFRGRIAALSLREEPSRRLSRLIADWDARMDPDSTAAAAYSRVRWALATILIERSGLAKTHSDPLTRIPPGASPENQAWWMLPTLLRNDDPSMFGGWTWDEALTEALHIAAASGEPSEWQEEHRAMLLHPLGRHFDEVATLLSPPGAKVGGDNETVWANGCVIAGGLRAAYGAISRYAFDVGDWDASTWIVMSGTSGDPKSPHYLDQHEKWSRCEMVPMTYRWDLISQTSQRISLLPGPGSAENI